MALASMIRWSSPADRSRPQSACAPRPFCSWAGSSAFLLSSTKSSSPGRSNSSPSPTAWSASATFWSGISSSSRIGYAVARKSEPSRRLEFRAAGGRRADAAEGPEERRLAAALRAAEQRPLAARDGEGRALEEGLPERRVERQLVDLEAAALLLAAAELVLPALGERVHLPQPVADGAPLPELEVGPDEPRERPDHLAERVAAREHRAHGQLAGEERRGEDEDRADVGDVPVH